MANSRPAAAPALAVDRAERALAALCAEYERRYGLVVFDIAASPTSFGGLRLDGDVLLDAQRHAATAAVGSATGVPVEDRIRVLTEDDSADDWCLADRPVVHVRRAPDGPLETQLVPGDPPVRRLRRAGAWSLVQLADGTIGWVDDAALHSRRSEDSWQLAAWRADWRGRAGRATEADWRAALATWWGAPYLWGGTTPQGVDCSGLTQRVYRSVLGIGLPKHSANQLRAGRRAGRDDLFTGDLVGLVHLVRRIGHVAVVLVSAPDVTVAHASLECGVVEEPLSALLARYRFRGARRFPPGEAP